MNKSNQNEKPLRQNVTIRLQPAIWAETKAAAASEGRTASDLGEDALEAYLKDIAVAPAA